MSEEHKEEMTGSGVIKTVLLSIFGILAAIVLLATLGMQLKPSVNSDDGASGANARLAPYGAVNSVPGAEKSDQAKAQPVASAAPAAASAVQPVVAATPSPASAAPAATAAPTVDGKAVFGQVCTICHSNPGSGAPQFANKADWAPRIAKGKPTLYSHALGGFNGKMPAKGGFSNLSDDQVKAAVDYMVQAAQ